MDSYSDNLPPIEVTIEIPDDIPTKSRPIIGEKPKYFPRLIRTVSSFGDMPIYYYDKFGIPSIEYIFADYLRT
jgi:hypothetical protein